MTTTQTEAILSDLEQGKRITPLDALEDYGCFRLGARIWELRHDFGKSISRDMITTPTGKRVAQYYMEERA